MKDLRFAVDSMLGGLAKWLRLLGFDTYYLRNGPGRTMADRILVTRRSDRPNQPRLSDWPRLIRLSANDTVEQLTQILRALDISPDEVRPFTRCGVCNQVLETVQLSEADDFVPEYVRAIHESFSRCPGCHRVYWPGTHQQRMQTVINRAFGQNHPMK